MWFHRLIAAMLVATMFCAAFSTFAQTCVTAPSGIVSWWAGESNALDNYGINNGTVFRHADFMRPANIAFSFDGSSRACSHA